MWAPPLPSLPPSLLSLPRAKAELPLRAGARGEQSAMRAGGGGVRRRERAVAGRGGGARCRRRAWPVDLGTEAAGDGRISGRWRERSSRPAEGGARGGRQRRGSARPADLKAEAAGGEAEAGELAAGGGGGTRARAGERGGQVVGRAVARRWRDQRSSRMMSTMEEKARPTDSPAEPRRPSSHRNCRASTY
ncbi:unnamed protein product [Urochloa humidicola]